MQTLGTKPVKPPPLATSGLNLLVVTQNLPPAICGVGDYATLFARELARQRPEGQISFLARRPLPGEADLSEWLDGFRLYRVAPPFWSVQALPAILRATRESGARSVHLHYVPQMYARAGVGLAVGLYGLWLRLSGRHLTVTFHELYVRWQPSLKWSLISLCQRLTFLGLLLAAHEIVVTTEERQRQVEGWRWWRNWPRSRRSPGNVRLSPVGSNFPRRAAGLSLRERTELQQKWALPGGPEGLVLSCLGTARWVEGFDWLWESFQAVQISHPQARLVLIGLGRDRLPPGHPLTKHPAVIFTGACPASEVSGLLELSDLYLLPLDDGVSGRRTGLMAGLEYGLPIVSTHGPSTPATWLDTLPARLCSPTEKASFVGQVAHLATHPDERAALGRRAAEFYRQHLSWPRIVAEQSDLFD